jgi:radical SAM protein with 4Fe4S-binding SPASM domain
MSSSPILQLEVDLRCANGARAGHAEQAQCLSQPDALEQLISNAQRLASQVHYVWHSPRAKPRFFQLVHSLQQLYRTDAKQEINNHVLAPRSVASWNPHFSELLHFAKEAFGRADVFVWANSELIQSPLKHMWSLRKLGADSLHFWPCMKAGISADVWSHFLKEVFESWLLGGHHLRDIEPVVSLLQEILCHEEGQGRPCLAQSSFHLSVRATGEVYTHLSVAGYELRLGNIYSDELFEMMASPHLLQLRQHWAESALPSCSTCRWQKICWTGALKNSFWDVAQFPISEAQCNARRQLCEHIARRLKEHLPASFPGLEWCGGRLHGAL